MAEQEIPPLLADFDVAALTASRSTVVVLAPSGEIVWVNPSWHDFAMANDGEDIPRRFGVGKSYFDGIGPTLRAFYEEALARSLRTGEPWEQVYECSSPEVFRSFHLRVLPIRGEGLLLEHSLVVEEPQTREASPPIEEVYVDRGVFTQCSNCRRMRRRDRRTWDWIPAWVKRPPERTSHSICETCMGFYWGALLRG